MRTSLLLPLFFAAAIALPAPAQAPSRPPLTTEIGPDHRVLETQPAPGASSRRIVVLSTGMNYLTPDGWRRAEPAFEETIDGFLASRVRHPARVALDLNVRGAVTMRTPSGTNLFSTPVAVTLTRGTNFLVIGSLTNCAGILSGTNQIVFENPFAGLCSSLVFSISENSWDQSVYFHGRIDPRDWGFPLDELTELSIWTEFYQPEQPRIQRTLLNGESGASDETLSFGEDFTIGSGYAFTVPTASQTNGAWAQVRKEYRVVEGRTFLIESFPVLSVARGLLSLPECPEPGAPGAMHKDRSRAEGYAALPSPPRAGRAAPRPKRAKLLARATLSSRPAVVADYRAYLSSGTTLLSGEATYLVSSPYSCSSLSISGGAVCKFKAGASITVNGPITCTTAPMRPAWFTSIDDDSVGESMAGFDSAYTGTNNPAGYANPALSSSSSFSIDHCSFAYAQTAVGDSGSPQNMEIRGSHCQFINCIRGIWITNNTAWNGSIQLTNAVLATIS